MKFRFKSCKFIKVFIDFCYKETLSQRIKENFNTVYCIVFCILMNCKHSFKNAVYFFVCIPHLRSNVLCFLKHKPN